MISLSRKTKEKAVEDLLLQNYDQYYRLAYSYVHNEADAGDIVQNGAYKAIRSSSDLKEVRYAATWLYRIILNEIFSFCKQKKTEPLEEGNDELHYEDAYENLDLKHALELLPPRDLNRITELMDAPVDVTDRDGVGNLENPKGSIEFRHLTFRYPDGDYNVLQDVSFQVAAGESVGIVGKTGAGKTTVVDLLLRTYNVPDGTLFVDGKDVNSVYIHSVRNACAYVPQDNFLFSDTIAHNIGFGVDDATFDQINGAASLADVRDNIVDFKEGYETILGERGVTVSGGQKQRISIARALLKNAPILILDDSVSAVDTRTEKIILDNLKTTRAGKTTLLIAHRISTVEGMDKIVFLEDGRVEAVGTHDALYHSCPEYRRMVDLQRLEDETADSSDAVGTSDIADSVDAPEHASESVEKCEGGASHD